MRFAIGEPRHSLPRSPSPLFRATPPSDREGGTEPAGDGGQRLVRVGVRPRGLPHRRGGGGPVLGGLRGGEVTPTRHHFHLSSRPTFTVTSACASSFASNPVRIDICLQLRDLGRILGNIGRLLLASLVLAVETFPSSSPPTASAETSAPPVSDLVPFQLSPHSDLFSLSLSPRNLSALPLATLPLLPPHVYSNLPGPPGPERRRARAS